MLKTIYKKLTAALLAFTIVGTTGSLLEKHSKNGFSLNAKAICDNYHYQAGTDGYIDGTYFKGDLVEFKFSHKNGKTSVTVYIDHRYIVTINEIRFMADIYDPWIKY